MGRNHQQDQEEQVKVAAKIEVSENGSSNFFDVSQPLSVMSFDSEAMYPHNGY